MATKLGRLDLNIPQVRGEVDFYPSTLEKGIRSEKALKLALAEMHIQGVSTRKVTSVLKKLCGLEISSTQVSNASKLLDKELEKWRNWVINKNTWQKKSGSAILLKKFALSIYCFILRL